MNSNFQIFNALHQTNKLFVLPNAWDAKSASLFQEAGFTAIGTSSAAVAASMGYTDGEGMSFGDYLFVIKRIAATVKLPLTVDLEMGYGRNGEEIYANIQKLLALGVVGINLEDSVIHGSKRALGNADDFARRVNSIKEKLVSHNEALFINARCDTYLLQEKNAQQETERRARLYETAGVDGLFLPVISKEEDIQAAVNATRLPLNVMCIPGLPDFTRLEELGVKRASMGPFFQSKVFSAVEVLSRKIASEGNFNSIL